MRAATLAILIASWLAAAVTSAQTQPPQAEGSSVRILAPKPGEKLSTNFVRVQYEMVNPASASGTPTFILRLDNRDPVRTTDTEHTFTGLTPGAHTVVVELVDANDTPIAGTRSELQFMVLAPPGTQPSAGAPPAVQQASMQAPDLPQASSPLPLLSVIGMGALIGGLASAMRSGH